MSSCHSAYRDLSRENSRSLINDFPVEILARIFKMIHSGLLYDHNDQWREVSDDELASPSLFPYSISRVCRYWDAVMASFPEFWERIVIYIDQSDHLELLQLYLNRSQSLELDSISVIRSSQDMSLVDSSEKDNVQNVHRLLSGHHPRTPSLFVRTLTTDSLPTNINNASGLRTLRLESNQRGPHVTPPNPVLLPNHTVVCEDLNILSLTGPIFVTLWRNPEWRKALKNQSLESLTIAHLRTEDGGENPFTFQELWRSYCTMQSIERLSWINVDVSYAKNDDLIDAIRDLGYLYTSSFTFDTVPANVLRAFYKYLKGYDYRSVDIVVQKFRSCSFYGCPKYPARFPFSDRIEVSRISNPDSLSLFFETADTNELLIYDCPGLDDASMNVLGGCDEQGTPLPRMWSLEIRDCPNFSVCALREFIEFRRSCSLERNDWETSANEIVFLSLLGSCQPLSEEEKEWFTKNVDEFKYENLT